MLRLESVVQKYEQIGFSPQNEMTRKQALLLSSLLPDSYDVFFGMKYTPPFLTDLDLEGYDEVVSLPLFPQFSFTTTQSALDELDGKSTVEIKGWHDDERYLSLIRDQILSVQEADHVLFVAHGIPREQARRREDPYEDQCLSMSSMIMDKIPDLSWSVCFQSRLGPGEWSMPYIDEEMMSLYGKKVVVVPLSFVCEHIETLHELDIEYADLASRLEIDWVRLPTLSDSPSFIRFLSLLVMEW